jgi:hypothetical protein
MITFRVRYMTEPKIPHVYCRVFVADGGGTFAATGNLTMRKSEFEAFRKNFKAEFIPDGGDHLAAG